MEINSFRGNHYFLSNYFTCENPIIWEGISYPSSEAAYHASKTLDQNLRKKFAACKTPGEAKKLSRKISIREDFLKEKVNIMREILKIKFESNLDLKQRLMETGNKKLIEGNTWYEFKFQIIA